MTEAKTGIPSSIEEVTPGWLSAVLGGSVTGARAEPIAQDSGFASLLYRVWLTGGHRAARDGGGETARQPGGPRGDGTARRIPA